MKNKDVLINVLKSLSKSQEKNNNSIEIKIYRNYKEKFDCLTPLVYSKETKTIIKHLKTNYNDREIMFEIWGYRGKEIEIYIYVG